MPFVALEYASQGDVTLDDKLYVEHYPAFYEVGVVEPSSTEGWVLVHPKVHPCETDGGPRSTRPFASGSGVEAIFVQPILEAEKGGILRFPSLCNSRMRLRAL